VPGFGSFRPDRHGYQKCSAKDLLSSYAYVQAAPPNPLQWWAGMLIAITIPLGATLLPVRMLPMSYALRVLAMIQFRNRENTATAKPSLYCAQSNNVYQPGYQ